MKAPSQLIINDFYDAALLDNFRLTKDKRLEKRSGSKSVYTFEEVLRGAYSVATVDGELIYAVAGNTLYKLASGVDGFTATTLGTLSGSAFADEKESVEMFMFAGMLYIIGGGNYYRYDGKISPPEVSVSIVEGYIPLIYRYSNANGVSEAFERKNLLTNKVRIRFCPDGINRDFRINGKLTSINSAWINGNRITDYTTEIGEYSSYIKFTSLFANNSDDIIEVHCTLGVENKRVLVTSCTHAAVYGGDTDSRVFLYGGSNRAVIYPSEPSDAYDKSTLSGEYFPDGGEITVGDGNLSVNGAVRQFDRLAIFTGDGAFYTYPYDSGLVNKITRYTFPILPLNSEVGATKNGGAVLVENEPYALNPNGLYRFKSTSVRDERLAVLVESPEFAGLTREFIESCKLYVNRILGELWCYHGGTAAIYNARLNCWYRFSGFEPDFMFTWNGNAAYGIGNRLFVFDSTIYADDGVAFTAVYESDNLELGNTFKNKTLYGFGVSLERESGASAECRLTSDNGERLEYNFEVSDTESEAPVVFNTRARLGNIGHLTLRIESPANGNPLGLREFMLKFR